MRLRPLAAIMVGCCLVLGACTSDGGDSGASASPGRSAGPTPSTSSGSNSDGPSASSVPSTGSATASPSPSRTPSPNLTPDPRNRFYTDDKSRYASDWYAGRHRIMIEYGCTEAPYYSPDPRCAGGRGFHHGIDIALPCGAEIRAGRSGRVIDPGEPGTPGPAYGSTAFRIRISGQRDVLIGHARKVFIEPGDQVQKGDRIALAGARGAPDGCHLHLEVRDAGGGVSDARDPAKIISLRD